MTSDSPTSAVRRSDLSRRGFLMGTVAGSASLSLGLRAAAQGGDTLRIGFISPRTGALAGFGETDGYVIGHVREALAGGIDLGGRIFALEILDRDTQSDPSRASQLARALINQDHVDLVLAIATPETVNPVSDACEAAGMPCLSTVMPWEAWYYGRGAKPGQPSPFKWTYHFGFGVDAYVRTYSAQWQLIETNKKVGVMYPNDADGNAIRAALAPRLEAEGFTIVDPGAYETGTTDFTSQIALFRREGVEIFNSFPIPPDFAAFWRQATQQGLARQIKIAQIAKAGLFPSAIEALGDLGFNLASDAYWHKSFPYHSSTTGITGEELAQGYEKATGRQWTQQLGATLALFDAGLDALKAASNPKDKAAVAGAISTLDTVTIAGPVNFNSGPVPNVASGPIIGTQWVKAPDDSLYSLDFVVTENVTDPNVPVGGKLIAYNS